MMKSRKLITQKHLNSNIFNSLPIDAMKCKPELGNLISFQKMYTIVFGLLSQKNANFFFSAFI